MPNPPPPDFLVGEEAIGVVFASIAGKDKSVDDDELKVCENQPGRRLGRSVMRVLEDEEG